MPITESPVDAALRRIPPLWPLTHFVAVNPYLGLTDQPFLKACALLETTVGALPLQSSAEYLQAYQDGVIRPEHLAAAAGGDFTPAALLEMLAHPEPPAAVLPTVADWLDRGRPHAHWGSFITEEIAKWCGVHFDENQTIWPAPASGGSLFAAWRSSAIHDRNPEAFGMAGFRAWIRRLPDDASAAIELCLAHIAPAAVELENFLQRELQTISGWAGHVQYRVREDRLRGQANDSLRDLLAIRLAYDAALFQQMSAADAAAWLAQLPTIPDVARIAALGCWQTAYELGYQQELATKLARPSVAPRSGRDAVQAVFCIDVRSEILRRHLEQVLPGARTIGFAGFFGFPVSHGGGARCPALLAPPAGSCETMTPGEAAARINRKALGTAWKAFQNSAISCFSFVETTGIAFGAAGIYRKSPASEKAPAWLDVDLSTQVSLAKGALKAMGLTRDFARLVLICGHGSHSANNPHASSLDCGACGGHAGDVNARLAAATLNDTFVRIALRDDGIHIPADTVFVAALHDTLVDRVLIFETEKIPESHVAELAALRKALVTAGTATRRERSAALGLGGLEDEALLDSLEKRGTDISQVRPEWGLANQAAFIAAPRHRTAGISLDGRAFLQDYDAANDPKLEILTGILTAPVVVASWINLQYYASRVDPAHFSAGDKALHQVIGGIGVTEGNGGDLKTGLPLQSIHDGRRFIHEPRRLSVIIDAAPAALDQVLAEQPAVRELFDHGWLHLFAWRGPVLLRRTARGWHEFPTDTASR